MVVGPDGFDLLGRDRVPPGTQSLANGARVVLWMMKEIDEHGPQCCAPEPLSFHAAAYVLFP